MNKQFDISSCQFDYYFNRPPVGPMIGFYKGIKFYFHKNEKEIHPGKPHIHCKYSGQETRIDLINVKFLDKPLPKNRAAFALKLIEKNQNQLINYWNEMVINGETIKFEMEI